ncbi:FAD-dependent oxidoreductase [Desulfobacterales bacterium HSG16]|nr:FAD-dependent oxidoreductase [Desulfobacterales bacterium HSG16]
MHNTDEVDNYPGFEHITGSELSLKFSGHAEALGLETISQEVTAVETGDDFHQIRLSNGDVLKTYSVILGTGGSPRKLRVPGEEECHKGGKGVSYCAVCDGFFYRNKTVVVVGGGDSAVEEALYLSKIVKKVYLAHRRDALRAGMLLQKRIKEEPKVEILWNTVVTKVNDDEKGVCSVGLKDTVTNETRELDTDGVFIFVGFLPNNQLVPDGVELNPEGYVKTDEKCETKIPGVFAIGDLKEKYARQIVTAAAEGCTAALASSHYVEIKKAGG